MWMYVYMCICGAGWVTFSRAVLILVLKSEQGFGPQENPPLWLSSVSQYGEEPWRGSPIMATLSPPALHMESIWGLRAQDPACLPHEDFHVLCVPLAPSVLGHGIAAVCAVMFASPGLLTMPWLSDCFWRRAQAEKWPCDHSILSGARLSTERGFPSFSC